MTKKYIQELDDQTLLDSIIENQANWRDMLSILLQRHHTALVTRCYFYLRNQEDAEDAAQETELRAFRAIKNFRGEAKFRTWLFAIGDRQCYDIAQKRSRHVIDDHLHALIEIHEKNIRKTATQHENNITVSRIITDLPKQERDVIVLRFYMELSLQDISETLDLGLSATKMRLYRALEKFSNDLQIAEQRLCY